MHRPTTTAARIRYQNIYAAPFADNLGNHRIDCFVVRDISLYPDRASAFRLNLGYVRRLAALDAKVAVSDISLHSYEVRDPAPRR